MDFLRTVQLVFTSLLARKARAFLTILGIVIGVAGVIIIISLGAGAQSLILGQVKNLGSDLLSVSPGASNENGPPAQVFGIIVTTLTKEDAQSIRTQVSGVKAANAYVQGTATLTWGDKAIDTTFVGTDSYYPEVLNVSFAKGGFYTQAEDQGGANVVVLGSSVAEQLFLESSVDPIGQVIKVRTVTQAEAGGIPLRVVGVAEPRGSSFFQDRDDQIYLPLAIGQQQLLGIRYLQGIYMKADTGVAAIDATLEDVKQLLDSNHRILRDEDRDFSVRSVANALGILTTITDALKLFLTAMAGMALVVGGIGILNIMLVTVAERTREIGLRKALGATNTVIRNQFLIEASTLTLFGGLIGIVFGIIVSFLISLVMNYLKYDWVFSVSISSVLLAIGVSVLTGVVFGLYPAFKAAKLNPIEALRYE
jgi:putative ABC transport system permease protein